MNNRFFEKKYASIIICTHNRRLSNLLHVIHLNERNVFDTCFLISNISKIGHPFYYLRNDIRYKTGRLSNFMYKLSSLRTWDR